MEIIDTEINLTLKSDFTSIIENLENLIKENNLINANIVCFVPHEVSSIIQIWWESWLIDDLRNFLKDVVPEWKWLNHDEPWTSFRYNFYEHMRSKLVWNVSITLIIKNWELLIWNYQDLYFYSPVFQNIPNQKIICRIMRF